MYGNACSLPSSISFCNTALFRYADIHLQQAKSTAAPTTMKTSASSAPATSQPASPITNVQTMTVSGVVVTQTVVSTSPPAPSQKKSTNVGAIVGGTLGGLLGLAFIAGGLFFLLRRRQQRAQDDAAGVQRNTSTLSRTGLLRSEKNPPPTLITNLRRGHSPMDAESSSPMSSSDRRSSTLRVIDQRLNSSAIMNMDNGSRPSVASLDDSRDYTRELRVHNPDPDPER